MKAIGVASILVLELCLHTGTFAQITPEVLRTLADHSDKMYYMENMVKLLQTHVTELTNRLDVMVAEKAHLTYSKLQDSSNSVCCNCCTDAASTLPSTKSTTASVVTSAWTPTQTEMLSQRTATPTTTLGIVSPTSTTTIPPKPNCNSSYWTPWIDRSKRPTVAVPGDWTDFTEHEQLTPAELAQQCNNGTVEAIECQTVDGISHFSSGEILDCSLGVGLVCIDAYNAPIPCNDYKVRYRCGCA